MDLMYIWRIPGNINHLGNFEEYPNIKGSYKMKAIKIFFILFLIGFTASCSSTFDVKHDFNKQVDFSKLKTFDWMQVPENSNVSSFVVQRVKSAVNAELEAKGLMMTSDNPHFLIAQHIGNKENVQVSAWGYGYYDQKGDPGGHWQPSGATKYKYEEGSLILDFVDPKSKGLMWRGSGKAEIHNINTNKEKEKLINTVVNDILKAFPPSMSK